MKAKSFVSSVGWNSFGAIVVASLNMVCSLLVIDYLGMQSAGFYALINSVIFIQATMGGFGLVPASIRKLSINYKEGNHDALHRIASTTALVSLIVGTLIALSLWLFGGVMIDLSSFSGDASDALTFCALMGGVAFVQQSTLNMHSHLQAAMRYEGLAYSTNCGSVIRLVGVVLVVRVYPSLTNLGYLWLFSVLCVQLVTFCFAKKVGCSLTFPKLYREELRDLFGQGKWILLTNVNGIATRGLDRVIFSAYFGAAALPLYSIPRRFCEFAHTIIQQSFRSIYPYMSRNEQRNSLEVVQLLRWFLGFLSGALFLGIAAWMPLVLPFFVKESLVLGWLPYMYILLIAALVHAQTIVLYYISFAAGKAQYTGLFAISGVGILGLMALGAQWGPYACAAGTLGVLITTPLFFYIFFHKQYNVSSLKTLIGPIVMVFLAFVPFLSMTQLGFLYMGSQVTYLLVSLVLVASYALLNILYGWRYFDQLLQLLEKRYRIARVIRSELVLRLSSR